MRHARDMEDKTKAATEAAAPQPYSAALPLGLFLGATPCRAEPDIPHQPAPALSTALRKRALAGAAARR